MEEKLKKALNDLENDKKQYELAAQELEGKMGEEIESRRNEINTDLGKINSEIKQKTSQLNAIQESKKINNELKQYIEKKSEIEQLESTARDAQDIQDMANDKKRLDDLINQKRESLKQLKEKFPELNFDEIINENKSEKEKEAPQKPEESQTSQEKDEFEGIENTNIHATTYQLDDYEKDEFLELEEKLSKTDDDKTRAEIRKRMSEILGVQSKENETKENKTKEKLKTKNDYDWGDLTEEQIDELWAEGITPDAQEYGQAYGNFVKMPHKPSTVQDDIKLESNPTTDHDSVTKSETPDFQPPAVITERDDIQPPAVIPESEKDSKLSAIKEMFSKIWDLIKFMGKPFARFGKFIAGKVNKETVQTEEELNYNQFSEQIQEELAENVQAIMNESDKENPWQVPDSVRKATEEVSRDAGKNDENSKSEQEKDSSKSEQENDGIDKI